MECLNEGLFLSLCYVMWLLWSVSFDRHILKVGTCIHPEFSEVDAEDLEVFFRMNGFGVLIRITNCRNGHGKLKVKEEDRGNDFLLSFPFCVKLNLVP